MWSLCVRLIPPRCDQGNEQKIRTNDKYVVCDEKIRTKDKYVVCDEKISDMLKHVIFFFMMSYM